MSLSLHDTHHNQNALVIQIYMETGQDAFLVFFYFMSALFIHWHLRFHCTKKKVWMAVYFILIPSLGFVAACYFDKCNFFLLSYIIFVLSFINEGIIYVMKRKVCQDDVSK